METIVIKIKRFNSTRKEIASGCMKEGYTATINRGLWKTMFSEPTYQKLMKRIKEEL